MKVHNKTYISCAICLILAGWIAWQTRSIPERLVSNEPGPRLFPYISAAGIALFSILSIIFDGRKEKNKRAEQEKDRNKEQKAYLDRAGWKRIGLIFLELLIFALLMQWVGFLITSIIMMPVLIWTLKSKMKISIPVTMILSVGLSAGVYFGFTKGFAIPLPSGSLWSLLQINMPF